MGDIAIFWGAGTTVRDDCLCDHECECDEQSDCGCGCDCDEQSVYSDASCIDINDIVFDVQKPSPAVDNFLEYSGNSSSDHSVAKFLRGYCGVKWAEDCADILGNYGSYCQTPLDIDVSDFEETMEVDEIMELCEECGHSEEYCDCHKTRHICRDCGYDDCEGRGACGMYMGWGIPPEPCDCCRRMNCVCSACDSDDDYYDSRR